MIDCVLRRTADRSGRRRRAAAFAAGLVLFLTACGSDDEASPPGSTSRPRTDARIQVVSPRPNQETGSDVTVEVNLIGAKEVERTGPPIRPDEGHIHIAVDGATIAMAYGDSHTLRGLTPGTHSVQVDFVAADHIPFANRVTAAVIFTVK